jgi:hypothetical protein
MTKKLILLKEDLDNNRGNGGMEIRVNGYKSNPECPDEGQIFIEIYEGKLRVIAWNGKPDPEILEIDPEDSTLVPCEDCGDSFPPDAIWPYKYEPAIKLCDDCHDNRMDEED